MYLLYMLHIRYTMCRYSIVSYILYAGQFIFYLYYIVRIMRAAYVDHTHIYNVIYMYIYIYIYMCVVIVCISIMYRYYVIYLIYLIIYLHIYSIDCM